MAVYGTFTGPDKSEITYKHDRDTCECSECDTARWQKIEHEQTNSRQRLWNVQQEGPRDDPTPYRTVLQEGA
jgi:hypothetical protein